MPPLLFAGPLPEKPPSDELVVRREASESLRPRSTWIEASREPIVDGFEESAGEDGLLSMVVVFVVRTKTSVGMFLRDAGRPLDSTGDGATVDPGKEGSSSLSDLAQESRSSTSRSSSRWKGRSTPAWYASGMRLPIMWKSERRISWLGAPAKSFG